MTRSNWFVGLLMGIMSVCCAAQANAWTNPVDVSDTSTTYWEASVSKISRGSNGRMHLAYRRKPEWQIYYRERNSSGYWGPIEHVSTQSWADRAYVVEDSQARPHVFYAATGAGDKVDLFEAVKTNGTWTNSALTSTTDTDEDYPCAVVDSLGRIHLIYSRASGGAGSLYYKVWDGSWSAETYIGSVQNTFYDRPDISIDSGNNIHVVWIENSLKLVYRKLSAGMWLPQVTIGATSNFFSYAKIAAASPSNIVVVAFDQLDRAVLKYTYSSDGGTNWAALQYLNDGHYPNMDADLSGSAHLVYEWSGGKGTGYRKWNGSTWTNPEQISASTKWQGWADVAADTNGVIHCTYNNNPEGQEYHQIAYVTSAADTTPPVQVTGLTAVPGDSAVQLSWTNPSDPDFQGVMIRCRVGSYPTGPADGNLVCNIPAARGSTSSFTHPALSNDVAYYYSAFSYDFIPNYSSGVRITATPHANKCGDIKALAEGSWVSLKRAVVTAVFASDLALYVEETDRSSGIRVSYAPVSGFAVGDIVDVSGVMATRTFSGVAGERVINATSVARSAGSVNTPLAPVGMACLAVGGSDLSALAPGVRGGHGVNNIGLLIKITGKVTAKASYYIWVDDGSKIADPSGKTGVMVKCPDTAIPVAAGNVVSVTGIAESNIYGGWTQNRRYLRIRNYGDIKSVSP